MSAISLSKRVFWVGLGDFVQKIAGFFIALYLGRILGPANYGIINIGISALGYAAMFADVGLYTIGVREMAKTATNRDFHLNEVFLLKVILGVLVTLISVIVIASFGLKHTKSVVIVLYMLNVLPQCIMMEWYHTGKEQFHKIALTKSIGAVLNVGLIWWFVDGPKEVLSVPKIYFFSTMIAAITLLMLVPEKRELVKNPRSFSMLITLFKRSFQLGLGNISSQVALLLPPIAIGWLINNKSAGLYAAAFKTIVLLLILDKVFVTLLFPALTRTWESNRAHTSTIAAHCLRWLMVSALLFSAIFIGFGPDILFLLFGKAYIPASQVLMYLSFYLGFTLVNSLFTYGLLAIGEDQAYVRAMVIGGLFTFMVVIGASLTRTLWAVGAAVALGELFTLYLMVPAFTRHIELPLVDVFAKMLLSVSITVLVYVITPKDFVLMHKLLWLLFPTFFILLKGIRLQDIIWLKQRLVP